MKKALSFALSMLMILSVFSCLSVTVSAASPSDVMYVKASDVSNDQITYTIYLKKNVTLIGTIVKVVYDPNVLTPVKGGAHSSASSAGLFVADKIKGVNNAYSLAFVSMDNYKVGSSDKAFMTVTFKVTDKTYPKTDVSFYCVEFSSSNVNYKIEKNDTNPALIKKVSTITLGKTNYVSVHSRENALRVEWKATPGATSYDVYKLVGEDKYKLLGSTKSNRLYFDDTDVSPNATVTYVVRGVNSYGRDAGLVQISGCYVKATDKITVAAQSNGGVKVNWNLVTGASNYRIYRRVINPNGTRSGWTYLGQVSGTTKTYTDTKNLESNTNYEYTVRTYTAKGLSAVCRFATIYYYGVPKVTVKSATGGVKVSWNKVEGATEYIVYRKYSGAKSWSVLKTVSASSLSYLDKKATSGKTIYYTVRAVGAKGRSYYKQVSLAYIGVPHVTSVTNANGGIQVKWNSVSNSTGYRVYRKAAGATSWSYLGTVKTTKYLDKNVKAGVQYTYTVKAVFNGKYGPHESGLSVKYVPAPKLTSAANSGKNVVVKWQGTSVATGYRVYRKAGNATGWSYVGTVKTTQYTDKNVKSGVTYKYTVRAAIGSVYSGYNNTGLAVKKK